ncbi:hypothetical protein C8Q77DRAFT_1066222 [Trametes polyzona]|nr:hypothetical protein C8Q77DRAFT_1066222 [Trametes polyzona]
MGVVFAIDKAYLIGDWMQSFIWGVYTTVFAMTVYTIYEKRRQGINKFTTITLTLLYLLATGHMALALVRLIQGFILYRNIIDPVDYFANISIRVNVAKDYLYIINLFCGDLIIVWRLYIVWGKNLWVAAIPFAMCLGELAVGYASISEWFAPVQDYHVMSRLGSTMFIISFVANVVLTLIIVFRIWSVTRRTRKALGITGGHYTRVLLLLIESGAFVSVAKLIEFTLYKLAPVDGVDGNSSIELIFECMPQITGLAPTFIIYAVNKGYTQKESYYSTGGGNGGIPKPSVTFVTSLNDSGTDTRLSTAIFAPGPGAGPESPVLEKSLHGTAEKGLVGKLSTTTSSSASSIQM